METNQLNSTTGSQPQTQDPQNNVGGDLQQNNGNLQPAPGLDQQRLPQVNGLEVVVSELSNSTTSTQPPTPVSTVTPWPWALGLALLVLVVLLVIRRPKAMAPPETTQAAELTPEAQVDELPKQLTKPKAKKRKTTKKRRRTRK